MLVEKFPYKQLSRDTINGKRFYSCPDGRKLPSVTTILSATKTSETQEALNNWKNRIGKVKAAEVLVESSGRGTRLHSFLEKYILTGNTGIPGTNPYSIQSHSMANHIIKNSLCNATEFYGCEIGLFYPTIYAGSTDCIALYEGEIVILDFKQSNKLKKESYLDEYRAQLCAYMLAHDELYGTKITRGINMICTPDLQYQQFEINKHNYNKYADLWWEKLEQYYEQEILNGE